MDAFAFFSDPTRLQIVELLAHLAKDSPEALCRRGMLTDSHGLIERGHGAWANVVLHRASEADHIALKVEPSAPSRIVGLEKALLYGSR